MVNASAANYTREDPISFWQYGFNATYTQPPRPTKGIAAVSLKLKHISPRSAFLFVLFSIVANSASADALVDEGQHALLTVSITVEGGVEKPKGYRDEVVKWSTKRAFEATVEMVAERPDTGSVAGSLGGKGGAQEAMLGDLQKKLEVCGQDQACQMRVAMQMMSTPEAQQTVNATPGFQAWEPAKDSTRLKASGSHEETIHTVYYTGTREVTDCTLTAPRISPELAKGGVAHVDLATQQNRETLEGGARAFIVEVNGADNTGVLIAAGAVGMGYGDIKCIQQMGSTPRTTHHSTNVTLLPSVQGGSSLQVPGTAAGNEVIASGSGSFELSQEILAMGEAFPGDDVVAPLKVVVRWELKKL